MKYEHPPTYGPECRLDPYGLLGTKRLVAVTGKKRAGKGVVASALQDCGFTLVKFAGPLKDMLRSLGLTEDDIEGRTKETPNSLLCGQTPRHAMQTLGTEWGRDLIGAEFWVNAWRAQAQKHDLVVVDDCRFPNEAKAVLAMGGEIWRVERPGLVNADAHSSETHELPSSVVIVNDDTIAALKARARLALNWSTPACPYSASSSLSQSSASLSPC